MRNLSLCLVVNVFFLLFRKSFINASNKHLAKDDAIELLDSLLRYDHQERLTAKEAMRQPYFASVVEEEMKEKK